MNDQKNTTVLNKITDEDYFEIDRAAIFMAEAHKGQSRKYIDQEYKCHPERVAKKIESNNGTKYQIITALLHDTIEDTNVTAEDLNRDFGKVIAEGVMWLTNDVVIKGKNRAQRVESNVARLRIAPKWVKMIKLADKIDNMPDIIEYDPNFAKLYMEEAYLVVMAVRDGDDALAKEALTIICNYQNKIKKEKSDV